MWDCQSWTHSTRAPHDLLDEQKKLQTIVQCGQPGCRDLPPARKYTHNVESNVLQHTPHRAMQECAIYKELRPSTSDFPRAEILAAGTPDAQDSAVQRERHTLSACHAYTCAWSSAVMHAH